jgi:hypothetical protein
MPVLAVVERWPGITASTQTRATPGCGASSVAVRWPEGEAARSQRGCVFMQTDVCPLRRKPGTHRERQQAARHREVSLAQAEIFASRRVLATSGRVEPTRRRPP